MTKGEKGEAVRAYQLALIDIGYEMPASTNSGKTLPDGVFGNETLKVTREFQKNANLVVDGIVGRQTLQALDAAVRWVIETEGAEQNSGRAQICAFKHQH